MIDCQGKGAVAERVEASITHKEGTKSSNRLRGVHKKG